LPAAACLRPACPAGEHSREHLSPFATGLSLPAAPFVPSIRVVPGAGTASHLRYHQDGLGAGQAQQRRMKRAASVSMEAPAAAASPGASRLQHARSLPQSYARAPWALWE
jgi:hypothetical protein